MQSQQPTPNNSLQQQQQLEMEFRAGVTAVLRSWSALRTAVESEWGGRQSKEKAELLRNHIYDLNPKTLDVYDLADHLAISLEEEFSVTLEDNSEQQVAETIFQMYQECVNGNPTLARQMVMKAEGAVALNSQFPVQIQTTEHDEDDDEDGDATMKGTVQNPPSLTVASIQQEGTPIATIPDDYLQQPLFGTAKPKKYNEPSGPVRQLGEAPIPEEPTVEMDEDGFATVQPKGRRRR